MLIYKIATADQWRAAEATGVFAGAPIDIQDGYIHFSTAEQAEETAAKHFAGQKDLLLVAIDADKLGATLQWEPSRGGQLFPHLYGPLALDFVAWTKPIPQRPDGAHDFTGLFA
jgi:uncharacterized protein (DUF952 family)